MALAMTLWAARPVVLADDIAWLTPGEETHETGVTAPELEEEASAVSGFYELGFDGTRDGSGSGSDESSDVNWLTPDEEIHEDEDSVVEPAEEERNWLFVEKDGTGEETEPVGEQEMWLEPDSSPVIKEESTSRETEWIIPDETPVEITEEPDLEEETWLTPDVPPEAEELEREEPEQKESEQEEIEKKESVEEEAPDENAIGSEAVLEVTIPSSGEVIINPHRDPVRIDGIEIRDQIINKAQQLANHSGVPIIVTASVSADTGSSGGLTIVDHQIDKGETDKLAYLYVEFANLSSADEEPVWSGGYTGASNQLLVSGSGSVTGDVLRVEAGDKIPEYASYRLFGSLSENPAAGWHKGDKLSVTVSFNFRAAEEEPETTAGPETMPPSEATEEPETVKVPVETEAFSEAKAEAKPEESPEAAPKPEPKPEPEPEPNPDMIEVLPDVLGLPADEAVLPEPQAESLESEKELESFASETNPTWFIPPDANNEEG